MKYRTPILIFIFILLVIQPHNLHATQTALRDVVISEIAWAGSTSSTADEWIELHNNTAAEIDLTDWQLISSDGTPSIMLDGIVPAGGYFLLERTDDTTTLVLADQLYTGALNNTGEQLTLTDDNAVTIDVANQLGAWFAGNSTTKTTMNRQDFLADGTLPASWSDGPGDGTPTNSILDNDIDTFGYSPNLDWIAGTGSGYEAFDEDCDDTLAIVYPGAPEILDMDDNDCDFEIDEGFILGTLTYDLYFNSAQAMWSSGPNTTITPMEQALLDLINNAATSIDVAIYGFDRASLRDALIAAHNRGVIVRVVADDETYAATSYNPSYLALEAAGIPVIQDPFVSYLQHNKFAIFDNTTIWTGSTNWTNTGMSYNINNAIAIYDPYVALAYSIEFNEMFESGLFANQKSNNTPHTFEYTNATVSIHFSPTDDVLDHVTGLLTNAQDSFGFGIFFWTSDPLGLLAADRFTNDSLPITGVWDAVGAKNAFSEDDQLCTAGVPLKVEIFGGKVHHKFGVFDSTGVDPTVILGSTNWSDSGFFGGNDENMLTIHNADIATAYNNEVQTLYDALPSAATCSNHSAESGLAACADGVDNDFDEAVDLDDPSCAESYLAACTDTIDNDIDGDTDMDDLDCYCFAVTVPDVNITHNVPNIALNWSDNSPYYEVWVDTFPYLTHGSDCGSAPNCTATTIANFNHPIATGDPLTNYYYTVRAANCGNLYTVPGNLTAEFDFAIQPGS